MSQPVSKPKQNEVATTKKAENSNDAIEDAANMNFMAQFVNHLLTPGSATSSSMQLAFNAIMIVLFVTWGMFLGTMPDSIHVWIFGFLIMGLTLTTNWFLSQVIKMKEESKEEEKSGEKAEVESTKDEKLIDDNDQKKTVETMKATSEVRKRGKGEKEEATAEKKAVESPVSAAKKRQSKKEM
jgi:hypothetical protein